MPLSVNPHCRTLTLNESPSEKEGKSETTMTRAKLAKTPQ